MQVNDLYFKPSPEYIFTSWIMERTGAKIPPEIPGYYTGEFQKLRKAFTQGRLISIRIMGGNVKLEIWK